jgi:hypothetical protein
VRGGGFEEEHATVSRATRTYFTGMGLKKITHYCKCLIFVCIFRLAGYVQFCPARGDESKSHDVGSVFLFFWNRAHRWHGIKQAIYMTPHNFTLDALLGEGTCTALVARLDRHGVVGTCRSLYHARSAGGIDNIR